MASLRQWDAFDGAIVLLSEKESNRQESHEIDVQRRCPVIGLRQVAPGKAPLGAKVPPAMCAEKRKPLLTAGGPQDAEKPDVGPDPAVRASELVHRRHHYLRGRVKAVLSAGTCCVRPADLGSEGKRRRILCVMAELR
jgi:hypothetical protein